MTLKDLYSQFKNYELKQIFMEGDDTATGYNQSILSVMNEAVIEVYSRFGLLQDIYTYSISKEGQNKIQISNNIHSIIKVKKGKKGNKDSVKDIRINDNNADQSIFTPEPFVIYDPKAKTDDIYYLMCKILPPKIDASNIESIDFEIPQQYVQPILYYGSYRAFSTVGSERVDSTVERKNKYEKRCLEIENQGLVQETVQENYKFEDRGFI